MSSAKRPTGTPAPSPRESRALKGVKFCSAVSTRRISCLRPAQVRAGHEWLRHDGRPEDRQEAGGGAAPGLVGVEVTGEEVLEKRGRGEARGVQRCLLGREGVRVQ